MTAIDASALLALIYDESGSERVAAALDGACISTVNLAEVVGRLARDGFPTERVVRLVEASALELVPFSVEHALLVGSLERTTRFVGLSLADRACLALAAERRIPALTADRSWSRLDLGVEIRLIR